jgi:hypothetical protein
LFGLVTTYVGDCSCCFATPAYNITHAALNPAAEIVLTTRPTPLQQDTFALLGLNRSSWRGCDESLFRLNRLPRLRAAVFCLRREGLQEVEGAFVALQRIPDE